MSNPEEALFDTWQQGRRQGMSAGIRYERERIIKLLESTADCRCTPNNPDWDNTCFCDAIALIKGETNEQA